MIQQGLKDVQVLGRIIPTSLRKRPIHLPTRTDRNQQSGWRRRNRLWQFVLRPFRIGVGEAVTRIETEVRIGSLVKEHANIGRVGMLDRFNQRSIEALPGCNLCLGRLYRCLTLGGRATPREKEPGKHDQSDWFVRIQVHRTSLLNADSRVLPASNKKTTK